MTVFKNFIFMFIVLVYSESNGQVNTTNEWISFYSGNTVLDGNHIPIGSVIHAYDTDGTLCGQFIVNEVGHYGFLQVYRDDYLTENIDEGALPGDSIAFKINGKKAISSGITVPIWLENGQIYELDLIGKSEWAPVLSDIPGQTVLEGEQFNIINLNEFIHDEDDELDSIEWGVTGNDDLLVNLNDAEKTTEINTPDENWFGAETLTFNAIDPVGNAVSDTAIFTVIAVNDAPQIIGLPDSINCPNDSSSSINVWKFVEDVETVDSLLNFIFSTKYYHNQSNDTLFWSYNKDVGDIIVNSINSNFWGTANFCIKATDDSNATAIDSIKIIIQGITGGLSESTQLPDDFALFQNYPNPFNPSTTINYNLPEDKNVKITNFNAKGEEIRKLIDEHKQAGHHSLIFDADDLSSGLYFYKITAGSFNQVNKMLLIK
jgi:hypothetical protein